MRAKRGVLSLLLVLAMLTVAFASILSVAVSADPEPEPEEIQDLGYQSSTNFAIGGEDTDLRFLFTIGSLDYDEVGFVFSFEEYGLDETPRIGETGCFKVAANTAHSVVYAGGEPQQAPNGRWWVAVKLTDIPFANYADWISVRAFVTDGAGTRYSDAVKLNVLEANRGEGKPINEAIGKKSTGASDKIEDKRNIYTDVLQSGAKTFHPTQENPTGNDLYVEYSVLFNAKLQNLRVSNNPYVVTTIGASDLSKGKPLSYWSPCDNISGSSCKTAGGFEDAGNFSTVAAEDPGLFPNMVPPYGGNSSVYANYPHVGGTDPENPEYGWHRIGIVYHEEVTNVNAVKGGADAEYYLTVSLYIDGNLVSVLCANDNKDTTYDLKLYTAEPDGKGGIAYTDIASDRYLFVYRLKYRGADTATSAENYAYCVFADAYATCGKSFVQQVERVDPVEWGPHDGGYRASNNRGMGEGDRYYRIVTDDSDFPGSISVMSYNIEVYDKDHGTKWNGRTPGKALDTVLAEAPDIVGFQEVNDKWDEYLADAAASGGYTRLEGSYSGKYSWEKNEIFFKTSKFTLISEGTKTFKSAATQLHVPNTEGADEDLDTIERIFHYAVLREKSSGKKILVVNTHLHYGKTGSEAQEEDKLRRYEIRTLLAWLQTQTATYPNQIVLGDTNAYFRSKNGGKASMDLFSDAGFQRTSATAEVKYDVGGTLVKSSYSTREEYVFDYILTKGNIDTAYYTVIPNPIDVDGRYPSDHIPVLAKIYLR